MASEVGDAPAALRWIQGVVEGCITVELEALDGSGVLFAHPTLFAEVDSVIGARESERVREKEV